MLAPSNRFQSRTMGTLIQPSLLKGDTIPELRLPTDMKETFLKRGMMESPFGAPKNSKSGEWDIYVLGMFNIAMYRRIGC